MSDLKQEIIFPDSGLNWDDAYEYLKSGDAPYRLNILVGEDGANGVITNMQGNRVVSYTEFAEGCDTHLVVGSCYDQLNRCVYYWVFSRPYDTSGSGDYEFDNRLLRFNEDTETIDTIFVDTMNYFGLDPEYPMKDPFIIGDALYFNPRVSEPKVIDVERAYNYTNYNVYNEYSTYILGDFCTYYGGLFMANQAVAVGETPVINADKWDRVGDSYADNVRLNFDSEFNYAFNKLRMPPTDRPACVYDYNPDTPTNNIKGLIFQFSYRYRYYDNTFSVFSAYSDVTMPDIEEYYNGEIVNANEANNFIKVNLSLGSAALVKEVEVVFKQIGDENWRRAKVINRQDINLLTDDNYVYEFYNNEAYGSVDNTLVSKIYDSVPRTAECQEIINKNVHLYGYCREGFDNLDKNDITVSLTPELEAIDTPEQIGTVRRDNINENDVDLYKNAVIGWESVLQFGAWWSTVVAGDIYRCKINLEEYTYTIQGADIASLDALVAAIRTFISTNFTTFTVTASLADDTITVYHPTIRPIFRASVFYFAGAGAEVDLYKKRGFKTGAWHPFCIFYYDKAMRRWDAQTSNDNLEGADPYEIDGTTVYIPMLNEVSPPPLTTAYRWLVNWEINHLPPEGAVWWRWGYAGNSLCSWFVQYTIEAISDPATPPDTTRIDITPLQTIKTTEEAGWWQFPSSIIDPYSWQKGDRVRFITEQSAGGNLGQVVDGVYDFEIIKQDADNNYIYIQEFDWATAGIEEDSLIEIYRPLQGQTSTVYYEFGELYEIIEDADGESVHSGQTQDQRWSTSVPATGVFDAGDVFHIMRTPSKAIDTTEGYFHESLWWSDFYDSDSWDKGKAGEETTFGERYLNIIRFSKQYLQNTLINGLSTFDGGDYKELSDVYGKIMRIIEIGDTLKVYQRKKPSSILIGKSQYYDAEGNPNVQTISDRVLGAIRYSNSRFGTEFPESIERNNRYVYGFDIYNGVFWRDSANGIFPISGRFATADGDADYKMDTYFKNKAKALLVSGIEHVDVMSVYDEKYDLLYVVFKDYVDESNNDTIVFHEPSNRWICFTEFDQTPAVGWNQLVKLTYSVVKGFEGGIGFSFNESDWFAYFDIATPPNFKPSMTVATLTYGAPNPTATVSQTVTGLTAGLTYSAPDPVASVSAAPAIELVHMSIDDGLQYAQILVTVEYDNAGDGATVQVDWMVEDSYGNYMDAGSDDIAFNGAIVGGTFNLNGIIYPIASDLPYTLKVKLSTEAWVDSITDTFISNTS